MSIVYCLLTTVYCLLSTVYCLLSTVYCLLSTVYCLLSIIYCLLSTVYCLWSIVHAFGTGHNSSSRSPFDTLISALDRTSRDLSFETTFKASTLLKKLVLEP